MWWMVAVVATVVVLGTYLTWLASRVDRLHVRAAAAEAALDAQLVRRAVAAATLGEAAQLPDLVYAARIALDGPAQDREAAENDLTRQLRRATALAGGERLSAVLGANRRVALARQVHTDVVRDARRVRRRPPVRLLRLARRHAVPTYFDIEDPTLELPAPRARPVEPVLVEPALVEPAPVESAPVESAPVAPTG